MRSPRIRLPVLAVAGLMLAGPALAQGAANQTAPAQLAQPPAGAGATPTQPPVPAPAPKPMTPPDDRADFMAGLRRIGVMAGQVVQCTADRTDRQTQISQAIELANQIALHFGLRAAFNFVGAVGYGSGKPFDKAGCKEAIDGWKQVQAKYLNK